MASDAIMDDSWIGKGVATGPWGRVFERGAQVIAHRIPAGRSRAKPIRSLHNVIEGVTDWGVHERPRQPGVRYVAYADAASGTDKIRSHSRSATP